MNSIASISRIGISGLGHASPNTDPLLLYISYRIFTIEQSINLIPT